MNDYYYWILSAYLVLKNTSWLCRWFYFRGNQTGNNFDRAYFRCKLCTFLSWHKAPPGFRQLDS